MMESVQKPMTGKPDHERPSPEFSEAMKANLALFSEVYQRELTPLGVIGYLDALRDLSVADLNRGCRLALQTSKFFPTPAEIRAQAKDAQQYGDVIGGEKQRTARDECADCRGTGWKLVGREDGQGKQATRCNCADERRLA